MRAGWVATIAAALTAALEAPALACASCGCGDPTLTSMGTEKPFEGRLRASLDARHRTDTLGEEGRDQIKLSEQRLDLSLSWAPLASTFVQVNVPFLRREIEFYSLARETSLGLGDSEVRIKHFIYQDRSAQPRHLLAVIAGLRVPTALRQEATNGKALPIEIQPGSGSFDPILGLSYGWFALPWSLFVSANFGLPTGRPSDYRASASLRTSVAFQAQATPWLAFRANVDTRSDFKAVALGARERDSGGFIAFAGPEVILMPLMDLSFFGAFRYPLLSALRGFHREGFVINAGAAYDF
jgi:hypothetical protein